MKMSYSASFSIGPDDRCVRLRAREDIVGIAAGSEDFSIQVAALERQEENAKYIVST